ncbi:hypothetical protein K4L44_11020 [Halosquirtibacter laminarini]|uniref:Uncharacterized protein n=1 Tax=Halosquirtibacter laminarini TaxID=3374600 RepID=A0AC61NCB0_9BACT|nr:hypothetical protein K4L44_11020 [Prolixibacteraceae bacterium]
MKRLYIYIIGLICGFTFEAQAQNATLFNLDGPNSMDVNPAYKLDSRSTFFTLPVLNYTDIQFTTGNLNFSNITTQTDGKNIIDFDLIQQNMGDKEIISLNTEIGLFGIGIKSRNSYYSFQVKEKAMGYFQFEPGLAKLITEGTSIVYNNDIPQKFTDINTGNIGINMVHYREFSLGYDRIINENINVGVRGKFLFGMAGIQGDNFNIRTSSNNLSSIDIYTAGKINVAAPIEYTMKKDDNGKEYVDDIDTNFDSGYFTNTENFGFGVDLGITYKLDSCWSFGLSVVDLGAISFKNSSQIYQEAHYNYSGIDVSNSVNNNNENYQDLEDASDNLVDEIKESFRVRKRGDNFSMTLPMKLFVTSTYRHNKWLSAGFLGKYQSFNDISETMMQLSTTISCKPLQFTTNYSYSNLSGSMIGMGGSLKLGVFQIYAVTDNILTYINPKKARLGSVRLGMNFIL